MDALPVRRQNEREQILRCLNNIWQRKENEYRPMCICSDSQYLIKLYTEALSKTFCDANVQKIDVASLRQFDVEPTINNIFVRHCREDRQNIYLLKCVGEIPDNSLNSVKFFLQSTNRKNFSLLNLRVEMNLSAVLPIVFCDKQNALLLKDYCDIVAIAPIGITEKNDILTCMINNKAKQHLTRNAYVDESAMQALSSCSMEKAEKLIDSVLKFNQGTDNLKITAKMLQENINGSISEKTRIGFGEVAN